MLAVSLGVVAGCGKKHEESKGEADKADKAEEAAKADDPGFDLDRLRETVVGVIYGDDDRYDLLELIDRSDASLIRARADAVFAVFEDSRVREPLNVGPVTLITESLERRFGMPPCPGERFADQPAGPFCTAFLVAQNALVTARHCFDQVEVDAVRFVRGFERTADGVAQLVERDRVYRGDIRDLEPQSEWLVVTLDRPVDGVAPIELGQRSSVAVNDGVYALGYPLGLPLKYFGGARVHRVGSEDLMTDLDAFGGVSGAPVLHAATHQITGILVAGRNSTRIEGDCWRTARSDEPYGELVQRPPD